MTASRTVHLFGGPYHGQTVAVPLGNDHLHIQGFFPLEDWRVENHEAPVQSAVREGTYSQVSGPGNQHNFEWDGWISH